MVRHHGGTESRRELYFVFKDSLWFVPNCLCRLRVWRGCKVLLGMEGSSALCRSSSELQVRLCAVTRHVFPYLMFQ
jgi:hypothetical protein